jgi:hypothetical protein
MLRRALPLLVLVIAMSRPHAEPGTVQAEVLFRNGKRLLKQGKIAEACAAFDASQKLGPTVSTVLNQANCREKNNQLATAWGLFLDAERDTRTASDEASKQLHQVAVDHAGKLEARLSTLEIRVPNEGRIDGLEIRRDSEVVDPAVWNQALPVDGGTYKITARAPTMQLWSMTVTIANEHDVKTVELPKRAVPAHAEPTHQTPAPLPPVGATPGKAQPGPEIWYCTESTFVKIGTCKPQLDACEAFRDKMLAHVHDLPACNPAQTATCFQVGNDPHCTPSTEVCDAMRDAATRAGVGVGACETRRASGSVKAAKVRAAKATGEVGQVDFDEAEGPQWACTDSKHSGVVGTCKLTRDQCEGYRSKLLERFPDLAPCYDQAHARCFDVAKDPHCAPTQDICQALREAAMKQSGATLPACYSRDAK